MNITIERAVTIGVVCMLGTMTFISFLGKAPSQEEIERNIQVAKQHEAEVALKEAQMAKERQPLLDRIEQQYGYRPQFTRWGDKATALVPRQAWDSCTLDEKRMLASIAMGDYEVWQVIVGNVLSSNNISIDETVASGVGMTWNPKQDIFNFKRRSSAP